jgi:hypothetical protein
VRALWVVLAISCSSPATPGDGGVDASVVDGAPADAPVVAPSVLAGLQWLLPCTTPNLGSYNCNCALGPQTRQVSVPGTAGERWVVTARIRGVMQNAAYINGVAGNGGWYAGGAPFNATDNYYSIVVSVPLQRFYINNGVPTPQRSFAFDYSGSFVVDGGATVTFESNGQDGIQWGNYDQDRLPIVLDGVTTTPQPYDGQFARIDLIGAYRP